MLGSYRRWATCGNQRSGSLIPGRIEKCRKKSSDARDRLVLIGIELLVVLGPVVVLGLTLGILSLLGEVAFGRITAVERVELYIVDLLLLLGFACGIYRLTLRVVRRRLPEPDGTEPVDTEE